MKLFKRFLEDLLSLLFPDLCCGCGAYLYKGETQLCTKCLYLLPYTDHHLYNENIAARQLWGRMPCHATMAMLYFKKGSRTQHIIHSLKYKGRQDLGVKLGQMIAEKLLMNRTHWNADLVIPVPLHPRKERSRGYNQSKCIAEGIAATLGIPLNTSSLLRKKRTGTQTKKGRYSRFENMQLVFSIADADSIKGKHVLLVDDVMTTGATLEACGIVLLAANIAKLSIATVAFAE
jgi:ComF family protein